MAEQFIKKQLEGLLVAKLSHYDPETNTYLFKKVTKPRMAVDHCYVVAIDVPMASQDSACFNLNGGSVPPSGRMKATVLDIRGSRVHVNGVALDGNKAGTFWDGWVPRVAIEATEEIG